MKTITKMPIPRMDKRQQAKMKKVRVMILAVAIQAAQKARTVTKKNKSLLSKRFWLRLKLKMR